MWAAIALLLLTNDAIADVPDDASEIGRLSRHARTLLDVAVHTGENDPKFLDWAESYCDSLEAIARMGKALAFGLPENESPRHATSARII